MYIDIASMIYGFLLTVFKYLTMTKTTPVNYALENVQERDLHSSPVSSDSPVASNLRCK